MNPLSQYDTLLPVAFLIGVAGVSAPWIFKLFVVLNRDYRVDAFFPWWAQLLPVLGLTLAAWRLRGTDPSTDALTLGALTVVAAQLCGVGAVATRHARPYCAADSCLSIQALKLAAALVALSGLIALALCLAQVLGQPRRRSGRGRYSASVAFGAAAVGVITPLLAVSLSSGWVVTALGAATLSFAAPWAFSLALAAWQNDADFTRGVLLAVAGMSLAAFVGPWHALYADPEQPWLGWAFAPAFVVAVAALAALAGRPRPGRRALGTGPRLGA